MTTPKQIIVYQTATGKEPYTVWLNKLRDPATRRRIIRRIIRVELGNLGDFKPVGDDVFELRIHFGPGYRIYFGQSGETVVILLTGGDKNSQKRDIALAKKYWQDYLDNETL